MTRAQTSSGKWNALTASAISSVVAVVEATSPPSPSRVRARSPSRPASAASSRTVVGGRRGEHRAPRVGEGQRAGVELGQEAERVHLERRRVDDPLEAVGRDVVAAVDRQPVLLVAVGEPQDRADDLAEHRPEVGAGVLGVVDLGAEPGLADGEAAGQRRGRHPDVDAELADVRRSSRRASGSAGRGRPLTPKSPPIGWRMRCPYSARVSGYVTVLVIVPSYL